MHCQACGHHHRTRDSPCQAITETEAGGARRCTCPHPHHN